MKALAPNTPVWIGSGATPQSLAALAEYADGFIVGSYFKPGGDTSRPVDLQKVAGFMGAVDGVPG